jgi:hypothetical protein
MEGAPIRIQPTADGRWRRLSRGEQMPISVWFVRNDTGRRDDSAPERVLQNVEDAVQLAKAHKAGGHGDEHVLRVSASAGMLSSLDHERLVKAGAEVM